MGFSQPIFREISLKIHIKRKPPTYKPRKWLFDEGAMKKYLIFGGAVIPSVIAVDKQKS